MIGYLVRYGSLIMRHLPNDLDEMLRPGSRTTWRRPCAAAMETAARAISPAAPALTAQQIALSGSSLPGGRSTQPPGGVAQGECRVGGARDHRGVDRGGGVGDPGALVASIRDRPGLGVAHYTREVTVLLRDDAFAPPPAL